MVGRFFRPATDRRLGRPLPHQLPDRTIAAPKAPKLCSLEIMMYYPQFPTAIHHLGVRSIVLLTLSPLTLAGSFDLHVLAMPPAFNLSHDQTLQLIFLGSTVHCCTAEVFQRSRPCCQPQDHCWPWCCRSTSSSTLSGLPASPIVRLRTTVLRGSIISHPPGLTPTDTLHEFVPQSRL